MVKKATLIMVSLTTAFFLIVFGTFIGRSTKGATVDLHASALVSDEAEQGKQPETYKFNINTISYEQLINLPGIGETTAGRILEFRKENGPFLSMDQLLQIEGIGEGRLETLKKYLTVGG